MKAMKNKIGTLRITLVALAAGITLGMSSCSTTTGKFDSGRQGGAPVGKRVADTALSGAAFPLKAAGWLIVTPFALAAEAMY